MAGNKRKTRSPHYPFKATRVCLKPGRAEKNHGFFLNNEHLCFPMKTALAISEMLP